MSLTHQQAMFLLYVGWNDRIVRLPFHLESALQAYDELVGGSEPGTAPVYSDWSRHRIAAELYDLGLIGLRKHRLLGERMQPWRGIGRIEELLEVKALRDRLRMESLNYVPTRFVVLLDEAQALARIWGGHGRLGVKSSVTDLPLQAARQRLARAVSSGVN